MVKNALEMLLIFAFEDDSIVLDSFNKVAICPLVIVNRDLLKF